MKEINEEINLTINLMQADIDDGAHGELQSHLYSLLEIKRNELQQRLVECKVEYVVPDQKPNKIEPLTTEDLKAGGWWCGDVSEDCANAFKYKNVPVFNPSNWKDDIGWEGCLLDDGLVVRVAYSVRGDKQIHRIGNEFYWGEERAND